MDERLILTNARLFDTGSGRFTGDRSLIIEQGSITHIGDNGIEWCPDDQVIDCHGRFVIPGLWECHGHLLDCAVTAPENQKRILSNLNLPSDTSWDGFVQDRLLDFLHRGITHVRDVGGPLDNLSLLSRSISDGRFDGPDIFFAGPMLERPPLHWEPKNRRNPGFTVPVEKTEDVLPILDRLKRRGASLVKTFNKFDRDVFGYLVDAARDYGLPVTHDPGGALYQWVPIDVAMERGVRCFEHAQAAIPVILSPAWSAEHEKHKDSPPESERNRAFFGEFLSHADEAVDRNRLDDLCLLMVKKDVCYCPTLWTLMPLRTVFNTEAPNEQEALRRRKNQSFCGILRMIVETMASHGVKILVGHDSGSPEGTAKEMELLEEWGVDPVEIIKGATCYPAQWFGVDDRMGNIAETKAADLVVLNEDPLLNISSVRSVWAVCHRGQWTPLDNQPERTP
jgi:imidazolonepropionase-like amidohydrolase